MFVELFVRHVALLKHGLELQANDHVVVVVVAVV
jgi:hypothetical protein